MKILKILNNSLLTPNYKGDHNDVFRKQIPENILETDRKT